MSAQDEPRSFRFSFDVAATSEKDLDQQIEALTMRLDAIVEKFPVTDPKGEKIPLIKWILQLTHNRDELEGLGKALTRVAGIVEELDDKKGQKAIFELARKNPSRLAWMFGDFSEDIDRLITQNGEESS